jgi:COMPASS component SWD3
MAAGWPLLVRSLTFHNSALDTTVKIWNAYNGEYQKSLEGHTGGISDIAWSSDSKFLCSASDDTTIIVWNVEKVLT